MQAEKQIENAILEYLALKNVYAFKVKTQGTYDASIKTFRKPSKYYMKGIADILGCYQGRALAIEVKSKKGYLNPGQKIFRDRWLESGGLYLLAKSIEDVESWLESTFPRAS